ncbi:carboxypeptidase regulatory-like domain-containing protein [Jatrophihabitans cynanchi]|uniref:alpha-amylase n=1 Tax=Jatrophihabitans cynanchi TaxID=2944128 RepID=A0ABY7K0M9_9ACTN|nr:carboxypeptidase regulatory-like domain-containing protein [Jatrophihabitans sp. SB3-54]WAX57725.1 carboxypeptidase regulatory-like domain-containing protein [Jatrophihabitans sp. SB3-54]
MRVDVSPLQADLQPNVSQLITVTISNTATIIAGYAIRVLGADPGWVQLDTDEIALFPDETRVLTIMVDVPRGIPAGARRIAVQVRELTPPYESKVTEIDLTVPPNPVVQLRVDPMAITAGKRATFSLLVENTGNTAIRGFLAGDDPENQVRFDFEPAHVSLAPGQHSVLDMRASAKRHFLGTPTVRSLSVYLDEIAPDAFLEPPPAQPASGEEREPLAGATFIQKSVMSRSALSLLGLLFAATVFAVVITIALSRLVAQSTADRNLALQVAAAKNNAATTGQSGVSGVVSLLTSGKPVAGVTASVFATSDTTTPVATTATNAKGAYSVTDLPAGKYLLSFRGAGFVQIWYPGAVNAADATTITLAAGQVQGGLNVSLGGVPASISGTVVGDDVSAATLFLETLPGGATTDAAAGRPLGTAPVPVTPPDNGGAVVQRVPIGSDGSFSLANVPSPSVYELVVVKTGYATSTQRIDVGAGETRTGVHLTLSKGDGLISGTITSQDGPLADVTVTATAGQQTASTVSLTGAHAGTFTLRQLPTPATFTLVASAAGFASQTVTLSLGSGQKLAGVSITLNKSSASLHGVVSLLPRNERAAGVGVTVTDGQLTVQTATESKGNIGSWVVGGLAVPGTYTVTFARSDLQSQTVSVSLDAAGNLTPGSLGAQITSSGIAVSMTPATATVWGQISQPGGGHVCDTSTNALGEATISLSSGASTYSVTSASVAPNCGMYRIEQIPPGTYTLAVSAGSGTSPSAQVITLVAGQSLHRNVPLAPPASMSGTVVGCTTGPCLNWTVFLYRQADYPTTLAATTQTDGATGRFEFDNLEAGTYIVAVGSTGDPANATTTEQVTVEPSKPHDGVVITVTS